MVRNQAAHTNRSLRTLGGQGFKNLRALMQDDTTNAPMPAGATLNNGNTFLIATSLDPTGLDEFWTEEYVVSNQIPLTMGSCISSTDPHDQFQEAQQIAYKAFHAAVKGLLNPDSGDPVPLSLMFSSFRSLRFGRILSEQHHQDTTYGDKTWFGGLTKMNAEPNDPRLEVTDNGDESGLGNGAWSTKWPHNATTSPVDDVEVAVNYVKRCIEFANYCNGKSDLGASPVIDVYLDLELFQLSHVAPSGDSSLGVGAMYPGIDQMPEQCLEQAGILDDKGRPQSYWVVPASTADAFWRTLQWCRGLIDDYNTSRSTGDVKLTFSVWSQEAYRFCSPRFAIEDTTTNPNAYYAPSTNKPQMFNQPFGSANIKRQTNGGTGSDPTYAVEPWTCDCARVDPSGGPGDYTYEASPRVVDDFNINNCIFKFVDRIVYGTYQSLPAGLDQAKKKTRNNTAVDFVGDPMSTFMNKTDVLPGQKVPLGGEDNATPINFAGLATFAPNTSERALDMPKLADGGWLLNPPVCQFNTGGTYNKYFYNPISAWPPWAAPGESTPHWHGPPDGFKSSDPWDCSNYWGIYDMPHQGWVPFAARMLHAVDQWAVINSSETAPKVIMTLELTPLDVGQAGAGGACYKNSVGNQWTWGDNSQTTQCASGAGADWPNYLTDNLCQADRVTYIFGGPSTTTTSAGDYTVGNAWGFAPVSRLLQGTMGASGSPLSDHLDPLTPYAFNNHMSYHCLMTHDYLPGYYASCTNPPHHCAFGVVEYATGERGCWNPYALDLPSPPGTGKPKFSSCACPAATQLASGVSTVLYHLGTPGDTTGDNDADIMDLLAVIDRWGDPCPWPCILDHDEDGTIGSGDLLDVIQHWGNDWN